MLLIRVTKRLTKPSPEAKSQARPQPTTLTAIIATLRGILRHFWPYFLVLVLGGFSIAREVFLHTVHSIGEGFDQILTWLGNIFSWIF